MPQKDEPKTQQNDSASQGADFTDEELVQALELRMKKLVTLIEASNMPDDVKRAWGDVIPDMTFEQLDRLTDILESHYLEAATSDIDIKFGKKAENLNKIMDAAEKGLEKEVDEQLQSIQKDLE